MKNNTLLLIILFITTLSFSQTKYTDGFNTGYKKGYCQDQGVGCIDPIPPIAPIPKIGESSDSYTDGYNRGFQMGLNSRKSNSSNSDTTDRTRYKTAEPKFVDNVVSSNTDVVNLKIKVLDKISTRALKSLENGDYESVIDDANSMIKIHPTYGIAYVYKSNAQYKLGQILNAYNNSAKALKVYSRSDIREWRDFMHKQMQEHLTSLMGENRFNDVIYLTENFWYKSNLGNFFKALGYYYKKDYSKSKKYFKKFKDNDIAKNYLKAIKNEHYIPNPYSGNKQEVNTSKSASSNTNENNFLNEAQELYQKKEFDQLIEKLKPIEEKIRQGVITDKKTLFFTYSILAYSHYNKNNLAETIKYTTQAIDNSLTNEIGDFYFLRGLSKSNIGDYYGANKDYDYLIKNYKKINYNSNNLATLYNNKGYNLILLKKYEDAEPLVNKAISLDKKTDYIWGTKGELEYYLGNYSDAVNAMSKSIKIKPTANSYYFRGLAEIELGNKQKGCSDLSKSGEMGETKAYTEIKNKCN